MRSEPARTALQHLEVVLAVEVGVDAALQADLGRPAGFGLDDAPCDLVDLEQIGAAAQVERQRALGEGAEPALEGADVRVVDVAVGDEGDHVADGRPGAARRRPPPPRRTCGPRAENSVTISSSPTSWPGEDASSTSLSAPGRTGPSPGGAIGASGVAGQAARRTAARPEPAPGHDEGRGHLPSRAPLRVAGEALRRPSGPSPHGPARRRQIACRPTRDARRAAGRATWPWASVTWRRRSSAGQARSGLTWSAVTGETPPQSSMPALEQPREVVGQVRRRLQVDLGGEHDPGGRDRPEVLVSRAGGARSASPSRPLGGSSARSPLAHGRGGAWLAAIARRAVEAVGPRSRRCRRGCR